MESECSDPQELATDSIGALRLDVVAAKAGKTWLLLPAAFRTTYHGKTYPLPRTLEDLRTLAEIPLAKKKHDSGSIYLRRAKKEWWAKRKRLEDPLTNLARTEMKVLSAKNNLQAECRNLLVEARQAVEQVKQDCEKASASMNDLFALGREGLEGMMRAHLAGTEWKGETVKSRTFLECSRLVMQTVKALGLPNDQRTPAREALMEEAAASLKSTQEAIAMRTDGPETEH